MPLINGLELYSDSFTPTHDKIRSHTINQKRYKNVLSYNMYVYSTQMDLKCSYTNTPNHRFRLGIQN